MSTSVPISHSDRTVGVVTLGRSGVTIQLGFPFAADFEEALKASRWTELADVGNAITEAIRRA